MPSRLHFVWSMDLSHPVELWSPACSTEALKVKNRKTAARYLRWYGTNTMTPGQYKKTVIQPGRIWAVRWPAGDTVFLHLKEDDEQAE